MASSGEFSFWRMQSCHTLSCFSLNHTCDFAKTLMFYWLKPYGCIHKQLTQIVHLEKLLVFISNQQWASCSLPDGNDHVVNIAVRLLNFTRLLLNILCFVFDNNRRSQKKLFLSYKGSLTFLLYRNVVFILCVCTLSVTLHADVSFLHLTCSCYKPHLYPFYFHI